MKTFIEDIVDHTFSMRREQSYQALKKLSYKCKLNALLFGENLTENQGISITHHLHAYIVPMVSKKYPARRHPGDLCETPSAIPGPGARAVLLCWGHAGSPG